MTPASAAWLKWWRAIIDIWYLSPRPPEKKLDGVDLDELRAAYDKNLDSQRTLAKMAQQNVDEAERLSGDLEALIDMMEKRSSREPPS